MANYSSIEEVNNDSLKKNFKQWENAQRIELDRSNYENEVHKTQTKLGIVPPHMINNMYIEPNAMDYSGLNPNYVNETFYDAQGDVSSGSDLQGSSLNDFRNDFKNDFKNDLRSEDSDTFEEISSDSDYSEESLIKKNKTNKLDKINKLNFDSESSDNINYKKIAKKVIYEIINKNNDSDSDSSNSDSSNSDLSNSDIVIKKFKNKLKHKQILLTDELKEVIMIIVVGVFIIMMLDFFVRVSKIIH